MIFVLVAEDQAPIARSIKVALKDQLPDHEVILAEHGEEALDKLSAMESVPDLCLVDIKMPIMNGYELIKEIRKEPRLAGVKIVVLSTGLGPLEREEALAAGANDAYSKPSDDRIAETIKLIVTKHCKTQPEDSDDDDIWDLDDVFG